METLELVFRVLLNFHSSSFVRLKFILSKQLQCLLHLSRFTSALSSLCLVMLIRFW